jgi:hypothetical protein
MGGIHVVIHKHVAVAGFAPELVQDSAGWQFSLKPDHIGIMPEIDACVKADEAFLPCKYRECSGMPWGQKKDETSPKHEK